MLDLHAHVLPGIDDGPRTLEEALALLRAMVSQGVQHVVATPHVYPGVFDNTVDTIGAAYDQLLHAATRADLPLTLSWGAEVRLCPEILQWLDEGRLPVLGKHGDGGHSVLVELPDGQIPLGAAGLIGRLRMRGLQVLIAHPERNRAVCENRDVLRPLMETGARLQLTAASVLGEFGRRAQTAAQALLDDTDWVAVVASDTHNLRHRPPRMGAAREWLVRHYGEQRAEDLTEREPAKWAGIGQIVFQGVDGTLLRDLGTSQPSLSNVPMIATGLDELPGAPAAAQGMAAVSELPELRAAPSDLHPLVDLPPILPNSFTLNLAEHGMKDEKPSSTSVKFSDSLPHWAAPEPAASAPDTWSLEMAFSETQPSALFVQPTGPTNESPAPVKINLPARTEETVQSVPPEVCAVPAVDTAESDDALMQIESEESVTRNEVEAVNLAATDEVSSQTELPVSLSTAPSLEELQPEAWHAQAATWSVSTGTTGPVFNRTEPHLRLAFARNGSQAVQPPPVLSDMVAEPQIAEPASVAFQATLTAEPTVSAMPAKIISVAPGDAVTQTNTETLPAAPASDADATAAGSSIEPVESSGRQTGWRDALRAQWQRIWQPAAPHASSEGLTKTVMKGNASDAFIPEESKGPHDCENANTDSAVTEKSPAPQTTDETAIIASLIDPPFADTLILASEPAPTAAVTQGVTSGEVQARSVRIDLSSVVKAARVHGQDATQQTRGLRLTDIAPLDSSR